MPDRYDPKLALRQVGERKASDSRRPTAADDPLAELAALVSGRGNGSRRPGSAPPPPRTDGDALGDLETELLNDLQASFAAVRDMVATPPAQAKEPPLTVDIEPPEPLASSPQAAPPPPPLPDLPDPDLPAAGLAERFAPEPPPAFPEPEVADESPPPSESQRRPLPIFLQLSDLQPDPPPAEPPAPEPQPPARGAADSPPSAFGGFQVRVADSRPEQPADPIQRLPRSRWERPEPPKQAEPAPASRFAPPKSAGVVPPGQRAFDDDDLDQFADMAVADDEASATDFPLEGFSEAPDDDLTEPPYQEDLASMIEPRRSRAPLVIASVVAVVLIGGIAVAMFRPDDIVTGDPPVIVADGEPTKITPDETELADAEQNKLIYDRVAPADDGETTLLAANEEPIAQVGNNVSDNPIARVIIPGGPGFDDPSADEGLSMAGQPSALAEAGGIADDPEEPLDSLGPRRVRTVVVKPDGTIVESAAAEVGAEPQTSAPMAAAAPQSVPEPEPPPLPERSPAAANDDTLAIAGGNSELAITPVDTAGNPAAAVIAQEPAPAAAPPPPQNTTVAAVDPAPAEAQPIPSGGMLVQVSSQRSEDAARATFRDLQARYPSILGRYDVNIQRAEIPDRGTFYRVRVGPFSASDAQRLCNDLKAAGGDCILAQR